MFAVVFAKLFPTLFIGCDLSSSSFFFLPPWWEYLKGAPDELGQCSPAVNFPHVILPVGLALLDIMIRLAGFVAIISIIIAGVAYITSSGDPTKAASARKRIYNSLIGLAIVFIAAAVVAFIGNSLLS